MSFKLKLPAIYYGWYLLAISVVIILYTGGVINFGFTAFFGAIAAEFGWSYAEISLAASLRSLTQGVSAPFVGYLVDRFGPKRLILFGSFFIFIGFMSLSRITSLPMYYLSFFLIAIGMSTTSGTVLLPTITNWFRSKANLTTGIVVSGFGMGGLLVPVIAKLINSYNWHETMVIIAIATLVIVTPLAFLMRHRPEKYGYLPDGARPETVKADESQAAPPAIEKNIPLKSALKSRAFWNLALSSMCHSTIIGAIVIHVMPYLASENISSSMGAMIALLLPVVSAVGRLSAGWFIARLGNRRVYTGAFLLLCSGLLIFNFVDSNRIWLLFPFVMLFSFGWGLSVTTRLALQRGYFGRASFGSILGSISAIMMVGNFSGAPLAGLAYDTWHTYSYAWYGLASLALIGAVLAVTIPALSSTSNLSEQPARLSA